MFQAIYDGPIFLNKSSDQQKQAATQNQQFTTQLQNDFNSEFANSQSIQGALNKQLQEIMNQGLAGQGFMPGEESVLRANSKENESNQVQQAQQALGTELATHGGNLTSGATAQNAEKLASDAAAQDAATQRGISMKNADLARGNVEEGATGLGSLAGQESGEASSVGGEAVNNGANSYNEVTQAYQPSNFWGNLAGAVAGALIPGTGQLVSGMINGPAEVALPISQSLPSGAQTSGNSTDNLGLLSGEDNNDESDYEDSE